jgi:hypothetical protein
VPQGISELEPFANGLRIFEERGKNIGNEMKANEIGGEETPEHY